MRPRPGRLLVVGYAGPAFPDHLAGFAARWGLGGVIWFARNAPDRATAARQARRLEAALAEADPGSPALLLVDQEGGRVERIRDGVPRLPPAAVLGRAGPAEVARRVAAQARALAALGVDGNLAPVCDVVQPGESGAIGDRSFGPDPARAASCAAAHVRATGAAGLLACAKHFPGHGAAGLDSHEALPSVDKILDELDSVDLVPFRAAVAAGVPLVMTAHVRYPRVSASPATLCSRWIGGVLRGRLGFGGAVISDDLEMAALGGFGDPGEVAVRAVRAGCDLLVYGRVLRPDLDLEAVARALQRGVPAARLAEAAARADRLREAVG